MSYHGDYGLGSNIYIKFTTVDPATGAPAALTGGTVQRYSGSSTGGVTTGVTLTANFNSVTGLNHVHVDTSGITFGTDVTLVLSAGTVAGVSVVGFVVGSFSIQNRIVAAVTGNVTGDVLGDVQGDVASVQGSVGSVVGNVGGNVVGSVGSVAGGVAGNLGGNVVGSVASIGAGGITATTFAANAVTASALAADAVTEIQAGLATDASLATLNDLSEAEVKAQVVAALSTDTYPEPGQGAPPATASIVSKLGYLHKAWRNRTTQTATQYSLYGDDATTVHHKATVSDDGTTLNRAEVATGP